MNEEHAEILRHAYKTQYYCGGSKEMDDLCESGMMKFAGRKSFVPDPYYKITPKGRSVVDGPATPARVDN